MKKIIFYSLIFSLTSLIEADVNTSQTIINQNTNLSKKELKKQIDILRKKEKKYSKMLKSEKSLREKLAQIENNYSQADNNFKKIKEIRILIEHIRENEECYVKHYRIQDLDSKIGKENDKKRRDKLLNIKAKINVDFISNCKNIKTNLLKKY